MRNHLWFFGPKSSSLCHKVKFVGSIPVDSLTSQRSNGTLPTNHSYFFVFILFFLGKRPSRMIWEVDVAHCFYLDVLDSFDDWERLQWTDREKNINFFIHICGILHCVHIFNLKYMLYSLILSAYWLLFSSCKFSWHIAAPHLLASLLSYTIGLFISSISNAI